MASFSADSRKLLEMATSFRVSCVLGAAAELDLYTALDGRAMTAGEIASKLSSDVRGMQMLLDALAALGLLDKREQSYAVPEPMRPLLVEGGSQTLLPMVRHMMCVLRSWAQLAAVVRSGKPAVRQASIRGSEADRAAFIAAMHSVSALGADELVGRLLPLEFAHLLDVGGASGTWTLALLRAVPHSTATIFDLPDALQQARERIGNTEFASRVRLAAGDFYADELPGGADLAWVSAIAHQHDRGHNRDLFGKVFRALVSGGRIGIRDMLMDPSRTRPVDGALFAVNMLVNTETGGTFTFDEFRDDLQAAGFVDVAVKVRSEEMNSVVFARKP
jgi:ubiquinone/menaquinone biosynthesis C-methylase UbiE